MRRLAPAQCVVVPPTVLQIHAGRFGKSFATRHEPDVVRVSSHESILKASHSDVEKSPCVCDLPASSTTTSMPFCASSFASVPPPAPDPMTTTTLPSLCLNCTLLP